MMCGVPFKADQSHEAVEAQLRGCCLYNGGGVCLHGAKDTEF
jgi:hypothetical protein